jgi:hypothetical protein
MSNSPDFRGIKVWCLSSSTHTPGATKWTDMYKVVEIPCSPPLQGVSVKTADCPFCQARIKIEACSLKGAWAMRWGLLGGWLGLTALTYFVGPVILILHILGSIYLLGSASNLADLVFTVTIGGERVHRVQHLFSPRQTTRVVIWRVGLLLLFVATVAGFVIADDLRGIEGRW